MSRALLPILRLDAIETDQRYVYVKRTEFNVTTIWRITYIWITKTIILFVVILCPTLWLSFFSFASEVCIYIVFDHDVLLNEWFVVPETRFMYLLRLSCDCLCHRCVYCFACTCFFPLVTQYYALCYCYELRSITCPFCSCIYDGLAVDWIVSLHYTP